MYGEALQSFERALPLVRMSTEDGTESDLLKMEAGILQNIGAVYNEQAKFSEAIIYHKAAATLSGELKVHVSSHIKTFHPFSYAHI